MKAIPFTILISATLLSASGAAPPAAAGESEAVPSRFLADDLEERISGLRNQLAIAKRERGPFGLYQNPSKTPVITHIQRNVRKTPFSEFINEIQISVVNAREKEFLVDGRMFRQGQTFPIVRGGERLSVRVETVEPSRVTFKNLQSGEVAVRRLDSLPNGVIVPTGDLSVPGVTPSNGEAAEPLHLELKKSPRTP